MWRIGQRRRLTAIVFGGLKLFGWVERQPIGGRVVETAAHDCNRVEVGLVEPRAPSARRI
jgi:hypothetical protein